MFKVSCTYKLWFSSVLKHLIFIHFQIEFSCILCTGTSNYIHIKGSFRDQLFDHFRLWYSLNVKDASAISMEEVIVANPIADNACKNINKQGQLTDPDSVFIS